MEPRDLRSWYPKNIFMNWLQTRFKLFGTNNQADLKKLLSNKEDLDILLKWVSHIGTNIVDIKALYFRLLDFYYASLLCHTFCSSVKWYIETNVWNFGKLPCHCEVPSACTGFSSHVLSSGDEWRLQIFRKAAK